MYQILLTLSTQILGYTFAGLTRQWLVRPSSMIWPGTLMSTAMFTTLHGEENKPADGWTISRWKFFVSNLLHAQCGDGPQFCAGSTFIRSSDCARSVSQYNFQF